MQVDKLRLGIGRIMTSVEVTNLSSAGAKEMMGYQIESLELFIGFLPCWLNLYSKLLGRMSQT